MNAPRIIAALEASRPYFGYGDPGHTPKPKPVVSAETRTAFSNSQQASVNLGDRNETDPEYPLLKATADYWQWRHIAATTQDELTAQPDSAELKQAAANAKMKMADARRRITAAS